MPQRSTSFFSRHKRTLASIAFLVFYSVGVTFATPPASEYTPGETLDPNCAPGDTFCSVDISSGMVSGTGTTNYLTKWTAAGTVGNSMIQDDGTNITTALNTGSVSVGTTTPVPGTLLQVNTPTTAGVGTITVTASSGTVTGTGTTFTRTFFVGDTITANSETHTITAIASNTSMTTDAWTSSASDVAYTVAGGNKFTVDQNGRIIYGTPISFTGNRYFQMNPLSVNAGFNLVANFSLRVSQTGNSTSNGQYGAASSIQVQSTNTQNYTGTIGNGIVGTTSNISAASGASGTATNVVSYNSTISLATFSATNAYFYTGVALSVSGGSITNAAGVAIPSLSVATNSTSILMGTTTIPTGTWGLYNATAYNNYMGTGNTGFDNTNPGYRMHVGSSSILTGTTVARFENAGGTCDVVPSTAGGITCTSDERLKKNITTLEGTILDDVLNLRPVTYHMQIEDEDSPLHTGFVAQELEEIFPDLVHTDKEGRKSVSYAGMMPYVVKAVQEMDVRIEALPVFEDQSLAIKVADFLRGIAERGEAVVNTVRTQKLCVGETCVNEAQLQQLLDYVNTHSGQQGSGSSYTPPEEPEEEVIPTPDESEVVEEPVVEAPIDPVPDAPAPEVI